MIPQLIERSHLLKAIQAIRDDPDGVPKKRQARWWYAVYEGQEYPAKYLIAKAAEFALGRELDDEEFSGGDEANKFLESRGFQVIQRSKRNPPWTRDEHLLALDFYMRHAPSIPLQNSKEIKELSELLNRINVFVEGETDEKFRNPTGVYMKLMNFRRFDPNYEGEGLAHGNKDEKVVWDEFAGSLENLRETADLVKKCAEGGDEEISVLADDSEEEEASEGRLVTRKHRHRERNKNLVDKKKKDFLKKNSRIFCQGCGFDFETVYGERGRNFIECHHLEPLSLKDEPQKTKLSDLALLCSNCHRIVHRRKPWLTINELKNLLTRNDEA
jgi:5-methylcytosine-specific restriction protein A